MTNAERADILARALLQIVEKRRLLESEQMADLAVAALSDAQEIIHTPGTHSLEMRRVTLAAYGRLA